MKPWLETARLGQKIVHELGLDHTNNLLSRWMAHRVAELMERAEAASSEEERESARHECSDLILRVWERRMEWPHGGPLTHILPVLRKLTSEPPHPSGWGWQQPRFDGTWAGLLPHLMKLHQRELLVCLLASFADTSIEAAEHARQWLQAAPNELSEEEQEVVQRHIEWVDEVHSAEFTLDVEKVPSFGSLPPDERTKHVRKALQRILSDKTELLEKAESRNEALQILEPNPVVGNIAKDEEQHAEYFSSLHQQIEIVYTESALEGEDEEDEEDQEGEEGDEY